MTSTEHPLDMLVNEIGLHAELSAADRAAVRNLPHRLRKLDAGSYLIREGDEPTHCGLLLEGYAIRQKVAGTGARQILALCIPGDAVDLQNTFLDVADHGVQMLVRGTVADIPRLALQELVLPRPQVAAGLIQMTLIEASILREWVVNVGPSADGRRRQPPGDPQGDVDRNLARCLHLQGMGRQRRPPGFAGEDRASAVRTGDPPGQYRRQQRRHDRIPIDPGAFGRCHRHDAGPHQPDAASAAPRRPYPAERAVAELYLHQQVSSTPRAAGIRA